MTEVRLVERVSFRDSDHSYHLKGKRIPSVTGIIGNLSKPALPWWAAKTGAQALVDHLESVKVEDGLSSPAAVIHEAEFPVLFDLVQRAHINIRNTAGTKGSAVHAAIEEFHTDFFNATPPDDPKQLAAWEAFTSWWAEAGLIAVETERKIVDPEGRYAGRLDLVAKDDDGNLFVCDVKTSNGVYTEAILQNAAYAHAIESEVLDDAGRPRYPIAGTKVLWLPEGCTKLTVVERDREEWLLDYEIFNSLVAVHSYRVGMDAWTKEITAANKPGADDEL